MAEILSSRRGSVHKERVTSPQFMRVSGVGGLDNGSSVILTGAVIGRRESVQHIKVLTNKVYVYAFGEDVGNVVLNGIVFHQDSCSGGGSIGGVNRFYDRNRAYQKGEIANIAIGGISFPVVLVGLNMNVAEGPFPFTRFSLTYTRIPLESSGGQGGGGLDTSATL